MSKILVVDDHYLNREFLLTLLGFYGHTMLEAADGVEGLALAQSERPDLVISDILMPRMDGYEFVAELRKIPALAQIPVIFYTATYREREALDMARNCGASRVLPKPCEAEVVVKTVNEMLGVAAAPATPPNSLALPDARRFAGIDDQLAQFLGDAEVSSQELMRALHEGETQSDRSGRLRPSEARLANSLASLQAVGLRLTALIDLGIDLAEERDPAAMLATACKVARNICVAKYAALAMVDDSGTRILQFAAHGLDELTRHAFETAMKQGVLASLARERQPLRLAAAQAEMAEVQPSLPPGHPPLQSFLGVPVVTRTCGFGWLYLGERLSADEFSEVDERAAMTVAIQLAVAYENLALYDEIQRHDADLRIEVDQRIHAQHALQRALRARMVMAECNHVMVHTSDEATLLQQMCRTVVRTGAYRMAWIGLADADGRAVPAALADARQTGALVAAHDFVADLAAWPSPAAVLRGNASVNVVDIGADAQLARWHELARTQGLASALTLPMRDGEHVFGVLAIYEDSTHAFDASQVAMFEELADDIAYAVVNLRTRSARERAEVALRASESKLNNILDSIDNVVWSAVGERIEYISPVAEKLYGRPAADFEAQRSLWLDLVHADDRAAVREWLRDLARGEAASGCEYRILWPDGSQRWLLMRGTAVRNAQGEVVRTDGVQIDITERKRYERHIEYLANHDALTGLANRNLLADRLGQAILAARREQRMAAVLYLDLDRFKDVNEGAGHKVGDALLKSVAARLCALAGQGDTVARTGGDEFLVLLSAPEDANQVGATAQHIIDGLAEPFQVEGRTVHVAASIGATVFPLDGDDPATLLRNADTAMYRAKDEGGNNYQFYSRDMGLRVAERASLESALRGALGRGEFELHYQPKVELANGRMTGVEALIRWNHPDLGQVSPLRFIPLAEDTGLIVPLGEWVLRTACRQNKAWQDAGLPFFRVAVNLSVRQFRQPSLVESVAAILQETGLDPQYLELEVTESLAMNDTEQFIAKLGEFKSMGVHLAIDDFGTGYSSLAYLKRFPVASLKIDKSFVRELITDADDALIVRSVISLGHSLNMKVIAEGVETEAQLAYLQRLRCDEIQGYLFSRPVPAAALEALVREGRQLDIAGLEQERRERTLLLVDDEINVASSLYRLLANDGYRILRAGNAEEALEMLARHRVQVIVSDQRLAGMSGTELLAKVKVMYPQTIRMILSGYTALEAILEAINGGAIYRFLTKPWDDETLRRNIREAFEHHWLLYGSAILHEDAQGTVQLWDGDG